MSEVNIVFNFRVNAAGLSLVCSVETSWYLVVVLKQCVLWIDEDCVRSVRFAWPRSCSDLERGLKVGIGLYFWEWDNIWECYARCCWICECELRLGMARDGYATRGSLWLGSLHLVAEQRPKKTK